MTREAVRKREYRAKLSDEKKNAVYAENAERSKLWRMSGTPEEIEARKLEDAARKQRATDKLTDEEKAVKIAKESAQRKARRHAAKARELVNQESPNPQNKAPEEFQRIQTPPRALTLKNQNSSVSKTLSHDEMPSGNSIVEDELSEYEKIRLSNIQEKNQKFQELFGHTAKVQKRNLPKSGTNSESSDEDILGATLEPTRRQPKRHCNSQLTKNIDCTSSDSSFEAHIDDLVDTAIVEIEDANVVVNDAISHLISAVFVSEVKRPKMKRNTNLGRKTKDTVRKATERYE